MREEPILTDDDRETWDAWMRAAAAHARTRLFSRRLDGARRVIDRAAEKCLGWCCMWSAGKDSTVMTHLLCVDAKLPLRVFSEKDDLDYPGEREYVDRLAVAWGLDLNVIVPSISPRQWIADHAHELAADGDMHSRAAGLSKACFYEVVEAAAAQFGGAFLGLRKEESEGRRLNRITHGLVYRKRHNRWHRDGQWIATPIGDWSGLDVYAYAVSRGIELLPVYHCVSMMHSAEPWRVRKSWWLPGSDARWGGVAWLRRYYPSLYRQLCLWLPDARMLA